MSRAIAALLTLTLLAMGSARLGASTGGGDAQLQALSRQYLAELEARDPLFADSIGVHAYDDVLPDYSGSGVQERMRWQRSWRTRLSALASDSLTENGRADRTALLDTIELELFEARTIDPWSTNPDLYVSAIGNAVYALTGRHYAPADVRFGHVANRLLGIPKLVDGAIANLRRPARVVTEFAIEQNAGNLDLYGSLTHDDSAASPPIQRRIAARLPAAVASLRRLQNFLQGPLLRRSNGSARVGAAVFDRELVLAAGTDVPRATFVSRARAAMAAQRQEMLRLALPLDRTFFPARSRSGSGDELVNRIVGRVMNRLADDHPTRDRVFATAKVDVASLERFLTLHPVVPLPRPNTLHVKPTPAFMAGFAGASLDPAGTFTPLAESYYYIDEIPASWSAQRVASYLREYNDYEMQMLSMHEAVPGHYVQFRYNNTLRSVVRRVFGNGSFIEGWAVWTEGMMLDAGYGGHDPRLRLFQLKWRLREEADAIIDAEFHAGSLTQAQCFVLLQGKAFQERSEALTKWHRLQLSHDQLSTYFAGLDAIQRAHAQSGDRYDLAAFDRRLLEIGDVEPRFVRTLL